jgi:RNA polymerase sigma-70 factor, ECF subfamily
MATGLLRRLALAPPAPPEPLAGSLSIQQVYEQHFRYVWRTLRALGVAEAALEDAAHDVFLVVQRKLADFDGQHAQLTTWLYEIALRVGRRYRTQLAKDAQRKVSLPSAHAEPDDAEPELPHATDGHGAFEQRERLSLARRALDVLDADKREAFVLACVEQRSAPEIADITGVPLNTVYSRIRAARKAFAEAVDRLEPRRVR